MDRSVINFCNRCIWVETETPIAFTVRIYHEHIAKSEHVEER